MDGKDDLIQLTHTIKEGSQYIEKFNLKIEGLNEEFTLSDYDAVFEKIELFDFDKDGTNEIILMFDTRGGRQVKLLTRQYMYGEEGHSDKVGNLVSVISSLDDTGGAFYAEEAWID